MTKRANMGMRQLDPDERNITLIFEEVRAIKNEMEDIIVMLFDLKNIAKTPRSTKGSEVLEGGLIHQMNPNLATILKKAKTIKTRIDLVNKSNENNSTLSDAYKEGSPVDLTRLAMTRSITLTLNEMMKEFKSLREMIFAECKESRSTEKMVGIREIFEGDGGSETKEMEKYFNEIYQAFLEMAVMVRDRTMDVEQTEKKKKKGRTCWIGCKCFC
ncbi:syntaxin-112-like [Primulina huaijiensis]|uniref:syntaxin-112-like n=1 Tax=Primulina huaijiensis TaxID=1492673 RepID=UPI003CC6E68D